MNIILIYFALKYKGDWNAIYHALDVRERVSQADVQKTEDQVARWSKEYGLNIKTILDYDYPRALKECYKPPFVLWYKGDLDNFKSKAICISSAHKSEQNFDGTNRKYWVAQELEMSSAVKELKNQNKVLISPFKELDYSYGIEYGVRQIHVSTGPVQTTSVPKGNLLVSEYFTPAESEEELKVRENSANRITASLATDLVLVSSTEAKHSNLITNFLNLGKEVYCFPKEASTQDFNNELIKQGANLITTLKDFNADKEADKGRGLS